MAPPETARPRIVATVLTVLGLLLASAAVLPGRAKRRRERGAGRDGMVDRDAYKAAEALIARIAKQPGFLAQPDEEAVRAEAQATDALRAIARREAAQAGFDLERLDKLAAEEEDKRKQRAHAAERRAIEASHDTARRLAAMRPVRPVPLDPETQLVDEVTFIRSFAGQGAVVESRVGPGDNFARYQLRDANRSGGLSGTGRLSFFTLWRNPRNRLTRVSVDASVQIGARLVAEAFGNGLPLGLIGYSSSARGTVRLRITVHDVSNANNRAIVADRIIVDALAHSGITGHEDRKVIAFAELVPGTATLVAARDLIMVEVSLLTEWTIDFGSVRLDAENGAFGMAVPFLVLTLN